METVWQHCRRNIRFPARGFSHSDPPPHAVAVSVGRFHLFAKPSPHSDTYRPFAGPTSKGGSGEGFRTSALCDDRARRGGRRSKACYENRMASSSLMHCAHSADTRPAAIFIDNDAPQALWLPRRKPRGGRALCCGARPMGICGSRKGRVCRGGNWCRAALPLRVTTAGLLDRDDARVWRRIA